MLNVIAVFTILMFYIVISLITTFCILAEKRSKARTEYEFVD